MASPFSIFRKNQRLWMAGAVLIAILAFVVAPMLQSFSGYGSGGPRGGGGTVAASWSGGSITQEQIENELLQLSIANTFLRKLAVDVRDRGGFPQVPEVRPDFSIVGIAQETRDPNTILQRKIMVAEAKRLGIHFDDQSVKTFLQRFVDGKLSGDQIQKTLREVSGGRMTLVDFYRLMREELAKNAVLRLANSGFRFEERTNAQALPTAVLAPPSKNWQYFQQFNRQATIEAYPVSVKNFETDVTAQPSDRELRALFDEGKDLARIDEPIVTRPAFMTPSMSDFEFIACDVDRIINEETAKIPEEILRAEYDRRVKENQFRVPDTSASPQEGSPTPAGSITPSSEGYGSGVGNRPPTLENPGLDSEPVPGPAPAGGSDQSSRPRLPSDVRYTSFQDPPTSDPPASDPPATDPVQTVPATGDAPASEPSAAISIQEPPAGAAPPTDAAATPLPPSAPAAPANTPPMRTQTFEEVRDIIAREQAAGQAFRILDQRVSEIRDLMEIYAVNQRAYERAVAEKDKSAKAPEPLNLQEIADKYGFQYGRTGLVDVRTASTLPIGRSRVTRGIRMQPFEFFQLIRLDPDPYESDNLGNLFVPLTSSSVLTRFIFWKVEHKPAATPTYEAAKESVESLWKVQQAAELAERSARDLAARVGNSSLVESLDDEAQRALVARPNPFTWYNAMFANFDVQLSTIEGLQPIGNDFMEAVFSASPGESIVVPDYSKETFYVVKVISFSPSDEELLTRFSSAPNTTGVQNAAALDSARTLPAWYNNLQKQLGLQQR